MAVNFRRYVDFDKQHLQSVFSTYKLIKAIETEIKLLYILMFLNIERIVSTLYVDY